MSAAPKFTPGPWHAGHIGTQHTYVASDASHNVVPAGSGISDADARLIAAAPELYEALVSARDALAMLPASLGYEFTHLRQINAVLAKVSA